MEKVIKTIAMCLPLALANGQSTVEKSYFGQTKNGRYNGFGVVTYEDGSQFQGNFINGKREGVGSFESADGALTTGVYENDEYVSNYKYPDPWSLLNIYYDFEQIEQEPLDSYSIDFELFTNVSDSFNLYIAPFGSGTINGIPFYGGIQTHCGGYTDVNHKKKNTPFTDLGRAIIFSRWGETSGDAIEMEKGGVCEIGDYEGNFISVRNHFNWSKGKYTISLNVTDKKVKINETIHTMVGMWIYSHETGERVNSGYMAFPGDELYLNSDLAIFAELYNESRDLEETPQLKMAFTNFQFNGKPVNIIEPVAVFPYDEPQWADARCTGNDIDALIGFPFFRNAVYFGEEAAIIYLRDY
jgi:hypothetical protein